jgi:phosphoribosylanthranilate isomerase
LPFQTRIKVCGVTRPEDVKAAVDLGVDAIGLNFHPASPRFVDEGRATELLRVLPPFVISVGLFVDAPAERIAAVLEVLPLGLLQFHGDEAEADCRRWGRPYLKVLRMRPELEIDRALDGWPSAAGMLLDAYRRGVPGGTGETFDWGRIPAARSRPLVLAGGLTADNVEAAIVAVRPDAVDVSGGVESAPGIKDPIRMEAFVAAVRRADRRIDGRGQHRTADDAEGTGFAGESGQESRT